MNRRYYSVDIILVSPLSLSSGLNENTDSDVLLDSRGLPYIPATSIAGVLSSKLGHKEIKERLYGKISPNGDSQKSRIIFYDGEYIGKKDPVISVRDSVALENKTVKDSAKFDFEIVEPDIRFRTYIEIDDALSYEDEELFRKQLSLLNSGVLRLGHKTTRGYGRVKLDNIKRIAFTDTEKWLDFDMYDEICWVNADTIDLSAPVRTADTLKAVLTLRSGLSIRSYTAELPQENENASPDYKYLSLRNGIPVIPGTTWAGAFRDRISKFLNPCRHDIIKYMFGFAEKDESMRSKITFSESIFEKDSFETKLITRNSIDRFSAATNDGALYTELTIFGGKTELMINMNREPGLTSEQKRLLLAALADLDNGFMAIGGSTSVGRGIFEVTELYYNDKICTESFKSYEFEKICGGEAD